MLGDSFAPFLHLFVEAREVLRNLFERFVTLRAFERFASFLRVFADLFGVVAFRLRERVEFVDALFHRKIGRVEIGVEIAGVRRLVPH